ncbi:hypothetical protein [Streptomyces colonosanans]|uniref:Lipoprotein n=1 Tax=Streptomyces colonosanans TaxID=1428652 RepID=A0A1S2Q5S9_9ACTN|nr:hypothetical protein [Streptomyces colonosanans]OIK01492.1 hypothetical protein BIV24_00120 [Streptomyces colonosanans]
MRRTAFAALCLATAAAAAAGLTGCLPGENKADDKPREPFAGLTGSEIADRAMKATTGASSLRMTGDVHDDESGGTIRIDMALNKKGECAGTLSMGGTGKAELIKTGDTLYMRYDEKFLRAQSEGDPKDETDAMVSFMAGKWTKMAATGKDAKDIAAFCDLNTVLAGTDEGSTDAERGATTKVNGTPAIVLHEKDGKETYTMYVATEGKPYLLKITGDSKTDPVAVSLTDYEKPVHATAPQGKVIDLDELGG